ncbi:hypothetical protein Z043_114555 [Scleropages formosus]|uniref:E3 ubiquitin-protein ligase NEURL1-like n=1 Tax=Scleropages formosus TaxID=113540 RepID=A0A0P7UYU5_SCLFO|nr:hypothetical protein Z043_114555 [Scleropages formosus]
MNANPKTLPHSPAAPSPQTRSLSSGYAVTPIIGRGVKQGITVFLLDSYGAPAPCPRRVEKTQTIAASAQDVSDPAAPETVLSDSGLILSHRRAAEAEIREVPFSSRLNVCRFADESKISLFSRTTIIFPQRSRLRDSEIVPPDCLRPRSFTTVRRSSLRREADESRLSVSLCDLNLQEERLHLASSACPIPQNSLNSQQSNLLPPHLDGDLHFHQVHGAHVRALDEQTVAHSEHGREERTLVFTSRPLRAGETVFVKVTKSSPSRSGSLSYGVTSCDPGILRPSDLPYNPESLVDRKEFWAVCRVPTPLQSSDILGFLITKDGEVILSHNGTSAGMQVCVDNSRPLWMFFGLHGAVTQLRILGSTYQADTRGPSAPSSPSSIPNTPTGLCGGGSDTTLNSSCPGAFCGSAGGTTPSSPISLPKSPTFPSGSGSWSDECSICYENMVDTVIYACGHMCLCYTCGLKLKKMANACCPICRRTIKDIIKTYRST